MRRTCAWLSSEYQRASKAQLKELRDYVRGRSHFHENLLVEGHRMIIDALQAKLVPQSIFLSENGQNSPLGNTLRDLCRHSSCKVYSLDHDTLSKFSFVENSQGALAIFKKPNVDNQTIREHFSRSPSPLIVLCDRVSDPGNLGSIIRSGYSFGVDLLLAVETCDLWVSPLFSSLLSLLVLILDLLSLPKFSGVQWVTVCGILVSPLAGQMSLLSSLHSLQTIPQISNSKC
jgi:tRNA G18 (ribose-2'-O)-methylase SpoU